MMIATSALSSSGLMNSGDCPRHVRSVRQDDRQGRDQAQNAEHANNFLEVRFGLGNRSTGWFIEAGEPRF